MIHRLLSARRGLVFVAVLVALLGGCAIPEVMQRSSIDYQPAPPPARLDASATIETVHTLSPSAVDAWKSFPDGGASMAIHVRMSADMVRRDWTDHGPFARIVPAGGAADYTVRIEVEEIHRPERGVVVRTKVSQGADGTAVASREHREMWGSGMFDWKWIERMPAVMTDVKAQMIADIRAWKAAQQQERENRALREAAAALAEAGLESLLGGSDPSVFLARERNRALVAAKNRDLPRLLREGRTSELAALVVRVEQTILDLNHEAEVAKDRAQQAMAADPANTPPGSGSSDLEHWRGLAISYRERIELLKPILAALKEEIALRNR